jgi:hypothetical protein
MRLIFPSTETTLMTREDARIDLVAIGEGLCGSAKTDPICGVNNKYAARALGGSASRNYLIYTLKRTLS